MSRSRTEGDVLRVSSFYSIMLQVLGGFDSKQRLCSGKLDLNLVQRLCDRTSIR